MIRNILIPEKIYNYYVLPTRIVGLDIGKTHISATKVLAKGSTLTVEITLYEQLPMDTALDYEARVTNLLAQTFEKIGPYDKLHTALPSSNIIFKELTLPFTSAAKIELVVPFEVEPLLPFTIDDAIIDFIITHKDEQKNSATVLVAIVQKQFVAQHLALFQPLNIEPDTLSIDLFALYGLYQSMPYKSIEHVSMLLLGSHACHIAYIHNNQLRAIRSLPFGIFEQAKKIGVQLDKTASQVIEELVRFGITNPNDPTYTQACEKVFGEFLGKISFTLSSFSPNLINNKDALLLLLGTGTQLNGLTQFIKNQLDVTAQQFRIQDLSQDTSIVFAHKNGPVPDSALSLALALPCPMIENFTLRRKELMSPKQQLLPQRQLMVTSALTILLLGLVFTQTSLNTRKLTADLDTSQQEAKALLIKKFSLDVDPDEDLDDVVQNAQKIVNDEAKLWFSFNNPGRASYLKYLLELTNRIDKQGLGFVLSQLTFSENTITMKAHVKDHAALAFLEKELIQSPLFAYVEEQDDPDFTMKIRIAKNPRRKK